MAVTNRHPTKEAAQSNTTTQHASSSEPPQFDSEGIPPDHIEFGGTLGTSLLMTGFPLLMWYMYLGAFHYGGGVPLPADSQSLPEFISHLASLLWTHAFPTRKAWLTYWGFFLMEVLFYYTLPGVTGYGKRLHHEGGRQLKYFCNAYLSLYATLVVVGALHFTGTFRLSALIDEFGPLLSVAILSGFLNSALVYASAVARGRTHRMSGRPVYDFFMGAELNPRVGILDLKMFYEVRIPWYMLLLISLGAAARQHEVHGRVSPEALFLVLAHWLYANACSKAEQLIITSWDMYFEKLGFMLTFWNMAGVPLSYCHCALYVALRDPADMSSSSSPIRGPVAWALFVALYLAVYWVWDSANGQKNAFRQQERGQLVERRTFPQVPWRVVKNPRVIETDAGDRLLVDGWFGIVRKPHYPCDAFFAVSWALVTGFESPFPWFYPVFFSVMIAHRANRDIIKCRNKYGKAWEQYEREVPYLFIPYVL